MARKKKTNQEILIEVAETKDDVQLMKLAAGFTDIWAYLESYIEKTDLKDLQISDEVKRTIGKTFKANSARRKKLEKFIADEGKIEEPSKVEETINDLYKAEASLLDEYAIAILCDFLNIELD